MAEPGKTITENRNIPKKSFFSGADNITNDYKYEKCSYEMENTGSGFTVFGKIELIKFFIGFNSF
jgi:hypothetical protein